MILDRLQSWQLHAGGAACCALLAFLGWKTVVQPVQADRALLADLRLELHTESLRTDDLEASRRQLNTEFIRVNERRASIGLDLQSEQFLNQRLADLTGIVDATGMTLQQTSIGEPGTEQWYRTVPLRLSGSGSFRQAAVFLREMNDRMPDVRVVAFSLSGKPGIPGTATGFTIDLVWFAAPALVNVTE